MIVRSVRLALPFLAAVLLAGCIGVNVAAPTSTPVPTTFVTPGPDETLPPEDIDLFEDDATPIPTPKPAKTPKPTAKAAKTPKPTAKPTKTPKPTAKPTAKPTKTPTPTATAELASWPTGAVDSEDAADHKGESGIVCGTVVAAQYLPQAPGRPTFLNIDEPYPNQRFNVVIWG